MTDQKPRELISIMMGKDVPFVEKSAYDQVVEKLDEAHKYIDKKFERIAQLEAALAYAKENLDGGGAVSARVLSHIAALEGK